jgi:acyl transferase domain-containing protein
LVALHGAVQGIQTGDCDIAIVLGINCFVGPASHLVIAKAEMLSLTCRCHTFVASADGYFRGEGCGAIVLKTIDKIPHSLDLMYGVVEGVAVAQDGKSASLIAPN